MKPPPPPHIEGTEVSQRQPHGQAGKLALVDGKHKLERVSTRAGVHIGGTMGGNGLAHVGIERHVAVAVNVRRGFGGQGRFGLAGMGGEMPGLDGIRSRPT